MLSTNPNQRLKHDFLLQVFFDNCNTIGVTSAVGTEFGTALTTILPILFQYCYKYCYSDSRNL